MADPIPGAMVVEVTLPDGRTLTDAIYHRELEEHGQSECLHRCAVRLDQSLSHMARKGPLVPAPNPSLIRS